MTATKKFFLAYSKATNAALHLMKNTGESLTDLLDLNDEDSVSSAKEQIEQGSVDGIILVVNKNILTVSSLVSVLKSANEKNVPVILILPDGATLPPSSSIDALDSSLQKAFRQLPIPFMSEYSRHCWKKIYEQISRHSQEPPKVTWYISCNPKNSIGLTLAKELTTIEETTFINNKEDFNISYCRKCIELADFFVLALTKDMFASNSCRRELTWALRHNKPIVVVRDRSFKLKDSIPAEWRDFTSLINGPVTLGYSPFYSAECAIELQSLAKAPKRIVTPEKYPVVKKQWKFLGALHQNPLLSTAYTDLARVMQEKEVIELDDGQVMSKRELSLQALTLDPNNSSAYCTLGDTLSSDDSYELPNGEKLNKRQCFLKAIELDANNELAYCDLADSLSDEEETVNVNGEEKSAIDLYVLSIKLNPNFSTAYNNLACQMPKKSTVTLLDGEVVNDKELFLRSLKCDSSDPLVFQNLGVSISKGETVRLPDGRVVTKKELLEWK